MVIGSRPGRLAAQRHDGRYSTLVLDRDLNAARNLACRGMAQLLPVCCLHTQQLQQLLRCMHRSTRAAWLEQQRRAPA